MTNLAKYHAANMDQLLDRITKNSIGMNDYFDRILHCTKPSITPHTTS